MIAVLIVSCTNTQEQNNKIINSIDKDDIAIIYTNDVHGVSDKNIGFDGLAHIKKTVAEKTPNVLTVDSGDFAIGTYICNKSQMQFPATMMKKIDYDFATLGNHEQDQETDKIEKFIKNSGTQFLACNYNKIQLPNYKIHEMGGVKIGFIGVCSSEQDNDCSLLYNSVQSSVNQAKNEGAEIIIALTHLGDGKKIHNSFSCDALIQNTAGIDICLDAHSHSDIESTHIKNKNNEDVLYTQAGSMLKYVGLLKINKNRQFEAKLISNYSEKDDDITQFMKDEKQKYDPNINQIVTKTNYALAYKGEGNMVATSREDELGNLICDAFKDAANADCALINATSYRSDLPKGDITKENLYDIFPFEDKVISVSLSGQQIMDALEHSVRYTQAQYKDEDDNPVGSCADFLQVSGLRFSINTKINSSVEITGKNTFVCVKGQRKVENIKINKNGQ